MKKSRKSHKLLIAVVLVLVVLLAAIFVYMNGIPITYSGTKYADQYRSDESGDCVYFTEKDFGDYESIAFDVKDRNGLFRSVGSMYTVTYSEEQYAAQLKKINAMNFLTDSYKENGSTVVPGIIPAAQVESDGWLVRILNNGDENDYPKQIAMIGTNDEENTMVYMYFTDLDLDFVSEDAGENELKDFIEKNFSFEF